MSGFSSQSCGGEVGLAEDFCGGEGEADLLNEDTAELDNGVWFLDFDGSFEPLDTKYVRLSHDRYVRCTRARQDGVFLGESITLVSVCVRFYSSYQQSLGQKLDGY